MSSGLWGSLRVRLAAAAAAGAVAGLVFIGLFLSHIFQRAVEDAFDDRLFVALRSLLAYAEVDRADGVLILGYQGDETRFDQSYQGWYWQVGPASAKPSDDSPLIQRSKSLEDWSLAAAQPADVGQSVSGAIYGPVGQKLRYVSALYYLPGSDEKFNFVVAGDYSVVTQRVAKFNYRLIQSIAIMIFVLGGVLLGQIYIATSPMRRMRQALADVRNGEAQRLEGTYLKEVEPLIEELNALLDHNAEVVERARTQVGNLAHSLKTPLAVLKNETQGREDPLAKLVASQTETMRTQIDHYLARARAAASVNVIGARAGVADSLGGLLRTMSKIHAGKGIRFEMTCEEDVLFRGEAQDLDEMLGNLIDNASKWAKARVAASARRPAPNRIEICIDDDGPGLDAAERVAVLERGKRLDESKPGSGLGLSIVKDIAQLYSGSLRLEESPWGGVRAVLELPAFQAAK